MSTRIRFVRFYECDIEADRDLSWGNEVIIHTLDTDKYFKIYDGGFVEIPLDEIRFVSPVEISKLNISGVPDGNKFLRDDGAWADAGGGTSHFLGIYLTLGDLQIAYPTASPGDYADVDAGSGTDSVRYIWDEDEGWIAGGGGGGHEIKEGGIPLTQRAGLNFDGDDFNLTDDAGNDETDVVINDVKWATKSYVDGLIDGLKWKSDCIVATTANIVLTGIQTIDGVLLIVGNRVLVKNQSTDTENGIYVVAVGTWSRATNSDTGPELEGAAAQVTQGTANANTTWIQTSDNITLGVTSIIWIQFGAAVPSASETTEGKAEIATQTETNTGTDDMRIVTPKKLKDQNFLAPLASPTFTGTVTVPTPSGATDAANKSYVDAQVVNENEYAQIQAIWYHLNSF